MAAQNAFLVSYNPSGSTPASDPVVEVSPADGSTLLPSDPLTVTVLFSATPTECVLEALFNDSGEAPGEVVYGSGDGFRGLYQGSSLVVSMAGLFYTFTLLRDGGWEAGTMTFRAFAGDSQGGST